MRDSTRRTVRTVVAVVLALAAAAPLLVAETGLDPTQIPWLATVLAVAAAVTRVMSSGPVEQLLARWVPWLAAHPDGRHEAGRDEAGRDEAGLAALAERLDAVRRSRGGQP